MTADAGSDLVMDPRVSGKALDPSRKADLSVGFILQPNFTLIAFTGFIEVLRQAADLGDKSRQIRCRWTIMGPTLDPLRASCGIEIRPWETFRDPREFHYVVVVGGLLSVRDPEEPRVIEYLKRAAAAGVPLVGVCTGSFVIARAGLMAGRRGCVHWYHYQDFVEEFPEADPVTTELFVTDGDRITCPGGASVVDLAIHLVERHCGKDRAVKALRHLLLDWPRPHDHPQLPALRDYSHIADATVRKALFVMEQHVADPPSIDEIAERLATGKRQIERLFQVHLGQSPASVFRNIRLQYGKWLLLNTDRSVTDVAFDCGFADTSHFCRWFKLTFGHSPVSFRKRRPSEAAPVEE